MQKYLPTQLDELFNRLSCIQDCNQNEGVSIGETDEAVFVEVPVPGIQKEKIHLTYEKGSLLIKAEEDEEKSDVKYHLKSSRRYAYRIGIPTRVDEQASPEASCKDGILRVKFPKSRSARPMKIEIKS